jgi:hypothetical protein
MIMTICWILIGLGVLFGLIDLITSPKDVGPPEDHTPLGRF